MNETKLSKVDLFAYLCFYKTPIGATMSLNNSIYKTIWENGKKVYNEKYICCFFTVITYKYGRVVLFCTSVYIVISKLMLLFSYFFRVSCIILCNVYFYIVISLFPFLFNWLESKASVFNQISHHFFEVQTIFFCSFQLFENGHIQNVVSTLINILKSDVGDNNIVLTLSKVF